jgi:hypothetical protein
MFFEIITEKYNVDRTCVKQQMLHNSVVLVRKRTIPTERLQPVGEVIANFS